MQNKQATSIAMLAALALALCGVGIGLGAGQQGIIGFPFVPIAAALLLADYLQKACQLKTENEMFV